MSCSAGESRFLLVAHCLCGTYTSYVHLHLEVKICDVRLAGTRNGTVRPYVEERKIDEKIIIRIPECGDCCHTTAPYMLYVEQDMFA